MVERVFGGMNHRFAVEKDSLRFNVELTHGSPCGAGPASRHLTDKPLFPVRYCT